MKKVLGALKKYLIPHKENDHRPHLLRPQTVGFVVLIALVAESVFLFGSSYVVPRSKLFGIILVNALVDGTNEARTTNSLNTLHINPLLQAAAQEKADDMVKYNYFAHTSPAGVSPWYWFQNVGYSFAAAGENLAVDFSDSQDVTNAWMQSPGHRANILNNGYTEIGMATAQGEYEGHPAIYVVELFGTPSVAPVPAIVAPGVNTAVAATPTSVQKPTPKPAPKPVVAVTPKPVPAPVFIQATTTATTTAASVAIKGAETQVPAVTAVTTPPPAPSEPTQTNQIQRAIADPRRTVNYFYFAIVLLFAAALILNFFVKVRIQHPQLIFGGMLVILMAGLLIVLNQNIVLLHAAIL